MKANQCNSLTIFYLFFFFLRKVQLFFRYHENLFCSLVFIQRIKSHNECTNSVWGHLSYVMVMNCVHICVWTLMKNIDVALWLKFDMNGIYIPSDCQNLNNLYTQKWKITERLGSIACKTDSISACKEYVYTKSFISYDLHFAMQVVDAGKENCVTTEGKKKVERHPAFFLHLAVKISNSIT